MNLLDLNLDGYEPAYTRTDLTDELHEKFGFRTDLTDELHEKFGFGTDYEMNPVVALDRSAEYAVVFSKAYSEHLQF